MSKSIKPFYFWINTAAMRASMAVLVMIAFLAVSIWQADIGRTFAEKQFEKGGLAFGADTGPSGTDDDLKRATLIKTAQPETETGVRVSEAYAKLPLAFEANRGQVDSRIKFLSRGRGYTLFLASTEAVLTLQRPVIRKARKRGASDREAASGRISVLKMKVLGANDRAEVTGIDELPGKTNYFIGNDPAKWRAGVSNYSGVRYKDIYRGVDLVYHGNDQRQLEYDFVVAPGTDPSVIKLGFKGAKRLSLNKAGDLVLHVPGGSVIERAPVAYQEIEGEFRPVAARYKIASNGKIGFELEQFDHDRALIIDPVLSYSTYLGGSGSEGGNGIAVDSAGNAYVIGNTSSTNFPTHNSMQATGRMFVTKLSADGSSFVYSTYFGSPTGIGNALGIAVDGSGSAYIVGQTNASDFPIVNPAQGTLGGGSDAFAAKLSPAGNSLIYSTFLGGMAQDMARSVAVDGDGNAYLTGFTFANNFPTTPGAFQPTKPAPCCFTTQDAFVAKLSPGGNALIYSSYLGGADLDSGNGIAVDTAGNAYVTGTTFATNFPIANAVQPTKGGFQDVFVTKVSPTGGSLVYSTFLGGIAVDSGTSITVDVAGSAYVTGLTASTTFPTVNPVQSTGGAFITKFSPSGTSLVYSTRIAGTDRGRGIALDGSGNAYIIGSTSSTDFPTVNAIQGTLGGGQDAFVTKISAAGDEFVYSTYLGGSDGEFSGGSEGGGIAVDSAGNAYVTGTTRSTNFPTANALQPGNAGSVDAFVAKLGSETPNGVPNAAADAATTDEDNAVTILVLANDSDPNGDALSLSNVTQGANGLVIINPDNTATYTPVSNFFGSDSFTYTVDDSHGGTATATVSVTVQAVNDAPMAFDGAVTIDEDTAIGLTLAAADIDNASLSFGIANAPLHGTLSSLVGNTVIYTPDPNFSGMDSFTFLANDGVADSNVATFTLNIQPFADTPVLATVGAQVVAEGSLLSFTLSASDADGEQLTFGVSGLPSGATLDPVTGSFSWTPTDQQAGTYVVTFSVIDPTGRSATETITITVTDVVSNSGPVCSAAFPSIAEIWSPDHRMVSIAVVGVTDPDNDPVTITIRQILQDEPTNIGGDGNTSIDGGGIGTPQAQVRAERSAARGGNGRVYEIFFDASDGHGNSCTGSVKVGVPHSQGQGSAVDDGNRYDSTIAGGSCLNCNQ